MARRKGTAMWRRLILASVCVVTIVPILAAPTGAKAQSGGAAPVAAVCSHVWVSNRQPLTGETVAVSGVATSGDGPNAIVASRFTFGDGGDTGWRPTGVWSGSAGATTVYQKPGFYQMQFFVLLASGSVLGGVATQCAAAVSVGAGPWTPTPPPGAQPTDTATPTATVVPAASATATETAVATATATHTASPTSTQTPTAKATPSPTASATPTTTPTTTATASTTASGTATPSATAAAGASATATTPAAQTTATRVAEPTPTTTAPRQPTARATPSPQTPLPSSPTATLAPSQITEPSPSVPPPTMTPTLRPATATPLTLAAIATASPTASGASTPAAAAAASAVLASAQRPWLMVNEVSFSGPPTASTRAGATALLAGAPLPIEQPLAGSNVGADQQWVELYNRSGQAYRMHGWALRTSAGRHAIPDTLVPGNAFVILVWDAAQFHAAFGQVPAGVVELDAGQASSAGLNSGGDFVQLLDHAGNVVSRLSFGHDASELNPPAPGVPAGHTLERNPVGRDTGKAGDFVDRYPPTPGGPAAPWILFHAPARLIAQDRTRDTFFAAIPTPWEFLGTPVAVLAANLLMAIMMTVVFGVCGTVLDNLVREQESSLERLLLHLPLLGALASRVGSHLHRSPMAERGAGALARVATILMLYAALLCFLDPGWTPLGPGGPYLFGVMFVTAALCGYIDSLGQSFTLRRWKVAHRFDFWPANFLVAAGAVLVSRLVPLQPGVIAGAPGGIGVEESEISEKRQDTLRWMGLGAMIALTLVAWAASGVFAELSVRLNGASAQITQPALVAVALLNLSLGTFYVALQALFFQMVPVATTYGRELWRRRRLVWSIVFVPTAMLVSRILVNPDDGPATAFTRGPVHVLLLFLGAFALLTAALWLSVRYHDRVMRALQAWHRQTGAR